MKISQFTIRVYALIINKEKEILLSDEFVLGMQITKFPGGGMELGEGTHDCLKRESMEEFKQELRVLDHFYTTDFFQQSITNPELQVISIYYFAEFIDQIRFKISSIPHDYKELKEGNQSFRWKKISELIGNDLNLPIDKKVAKMLAIQYK
jgi:8-oxo-dGTP diphosphatase